MNNGIRIGIGEQGITAGDTQFHTVDNQAQIACASENLVWERYAVLTDFQTKLTAVADEFGVEFIAHAEVGLCQQSRRNTEDLQFIGGGVCIAGNSQQVDLDHSLPRLDCREVVAAKRIGQCIDAVVQHHHRARYAFFARVHPAVSVRVIEDSADHSSEIENWVGGDFEFGGGRRGDEADVTQVDRNGSVGIAANAGARADDHGIAKNPVAALARICNAVAVGVNEARHISNVEYHRLPGDGISNRDAIEPGSAVNIAKNRR